LGDKGRASQEQKERKTSRVIYKSNLAPPSGVLDRFKHLHRRVEPWSYGHEVVSDFADKIDDPRFFNHRNCSFLTVDESAILFAAALQTPTGSRWLDIGGHTGFSGLTIHAAGHNVYSIDPEYGWQPFAHRWAENVREYAGIRDRFTDNPFMISPWPMTSNEFFALVQNGSIPIGPIAGALIDGNHDKPCPAHDTINCVLQADETCALVFHDTYGGPIQEALLWLHANSWGIRWYDTPNGMAIAWRGDFTPPRHVPDPRIDWERVRRERGRALMGLTV
jgi:hypothetical protein